MRNDEGPSSAGEGWEDNGFTMPSDGGGLRLSEFGDGFDRVFGEDEGLQNTEENQGPEQPHVSNGYWEKIAQTVAGASPNGLRNRTELSVENAGATLEGLIPAALRTLKETMEIAPDMNDPNFARLVSARKDAAVSVVNACLKADENQFKKRNSEVLTDLLKEIRKANPTVIDGVYTKN